MDLAEEDALRAELARLPRSSETFRHSSGSLVYTAGVKHLVERCRIFWFIDVIAACQPRFVAVRDLELFQLWEFWIADGRGVAFCSKDSERVLIRVPLARRDSALPYVRLHLRQGVLMLPSEHP